MLLHLPQQCSFLWISVSLKSQSLLMMPPNKSHKGWGWAFAAWVLWCWENLIITFARPPVYVGQRLEGLDNSLKQYPNCWLKAGRTQKRSIFRVYSLAYCFLRRVYFGCFVFKIYIFKYIFILNLFYFDLIFKIHIIMFTSTSHYKCLLQNFQKIT